MAPQLPHPIRLAPQPEAQPTKVGVKSPEDVVVVAAVRTAMTKGRKGGLKNTRADGKLFLLYSETTHTSMDSLCMNRVVVICL